MFLVEEIILHEEYDPEMSEEFDIALIKTLDPIKFNRAVGPGNYDFSFKSKMLKLSFKSVPPIHISSHRSFG